MANQTPKTSDQPKVAGSIPLPKSKRGLKGFISEVQREMKKVTWPTFKDVVSSALVVIFCVLFLMVFLAGSDYLIANATRLLWFGWA